MAKYMIDVDALKDCINLLPVPFSIDGNKTVYLDDVLTMIDKFPKEKYGTEYSDMLDKIARLNEKKQLEQK